MTMDKFLHKMFEPCERCGEVGCWARFAKVGCGGTYVASATLRSPALLGAFSKDVLTQITQYLQVWEICALAKVSCQ